MAELHPIRSVDIQGVAARAIGYAIAPSSRRHLEAVSVKTAEDAAIALGDAGNEHHCPLCNDFFTTDGFVAHARECIELRAPRKRLWVSPGIKNATQAYSEERPSRPGAGRFG